MSFSVKLTGVDQARKSLRFYQLQKKRDLEKEVARAVFAVEATAKSLVAVDSGRLRASITPEFAGNRLSGTVGTNVSYAFEQEFGSASQPNKRFTPYLTPALKANEQAFLTALRKVMSAKP